MAKQQLEEELGAWQRLVEGRTAEHLTRNQVIYTPETPAEDLLLLASGRVNLYLLEQERRMLTLRSVEPGQLFGQLALLNGEAYDSYAESQGPGTVYRIGREEVSAQVREDPALALELLEDLGRYRLDVSNRLDEVAFKSVPARLASVLLDMAPETEDSHPVRVPRRSHRQLAEMINAYRETVTKVLNQFRAARLLEIDSSFFTLVNRSRLEELAQGW